MTLYIGIDWSEKKHDVVMMNEAGGVVVRLTIPHSVEGFRQLDVVRGKTGVLVEACVVGLETQHNLLVDFLWAQGYQRVYVLPPSTTQSGRKRFKVSPAHSDQDDAELIAELLRVELHLFRPWQRGSELLQAIRSQVKYVIFLTHQVVRFTNRLRAVLLRYYPGAVDVFSSLDTQIALELIHTYPTPHAAEALTFEAFKDFARQHHYTRLKHLASCYGRLQQPQPQAAPAIVNAYQEEAVGLAEMTLGVVRNRIRAMTRLGQLYAQHPDYAIFHSLPQAGDFLEPALLAMFGEDRTRFPTANTVQVQAGTCPATESSGKRRDVSFRRACDRDFQSIAQQWAKATLGSSVWANTYIRNARVHARSENHALRCLANRWLAILWRLWYEHKTYDEKIHMERHAQRARPKT
jgi:transposase